LFVSGVKPPLSDSSISGHNTSITRIKPPIIGRDLEPGLSKALRRNAHCNCVTGGAGDKTQISWKASKLLNDILDDGVFDPASPNGILDTITPYKFAK
jgi:hypothetical protein